MLEAYTRGTQRPMTARTRMAVLCLTMSASVVAVSIAQDGHPLSGHRDGIVDFDFSPDGATLLSGSKDATARVWSLSECKQMALLAHETPVTHVRFLGNTRGLVVSASSVDVMQSQRQASRSVGKASELHVWDVNHATKLYCFRKLGSKGAGKLLGCAVAPDAKNFAFQVLVEGNTGSAELACIDSIKGEEVYRRPYRYNERARIHARGVMPPLLGYADRGDVLVTVEADRNEDTVVILDAATGEKRLSVPCGGRVERLATANLPLIAIAVRNTGGKSGAVGIRVLEVRSGKTVALIDSMAGTTASLGFLNAESVVFTLNRSPQHSGNEGSTLYAGIGVLDVKTSRMRVVAADETPSAGSGLGPRLARLTAIDDSSDRIAIGLHHDHALFIVSVADGRHPIALSFSQLQQAECSKVGFGPTGNYLVAACEPADILPEVGPASWYDKLLTTWNLANTLDAYKRP